jgi:hypothetical protein
MFEKFDFVDKFSTSMVNDPITSVVETPDGHVVFSHKSCAEILYKDSRLVMYLRA